MIEQECILSYKLVDADAVDQSFTTLASIRKFLEGIGEEFFESCSMSDEDLFIDGFEYVINYCLMWENL